LANSALIQSVDGPVDNSSVSGNVLAVKAIDFFGAISRTFPSRRRTFKVEVPALVNRTLDSVAEAFAVGFAVAED
jgi:hypothetical protein